MSTLSQRLRTAAGVMLPLILVPSAAQAAILPAPNGVPLPGTDLATPGLTPSPLGDVNGDGLREFAGRIGNPTLVVLGARSTDPVTATTPGRIWTIDTSGMALEPTAISGAGDLDGDGRDDIMLGLTPGPAVPAGPQQVIVFSRSAPATATIPGTGGATVELRNGGESSARAQSVGDFNGDGRDDLLISAASGGAVVLLGGPTLRGSIDLAAPGSAGIRIFASPPAGSTSTAFSTFSSIRALGDTNGDGLGDIAVTRRDPATNLSYAYVVPGRPGITEVDLANRAGKAFRVGPVDPTVELVALGDVNRDRLADLLVPQSSTTSRVIRGRAAWGDMAVSSTFQAITASGVPGLAAGQSVPADVNGDGVDDLTMSGAVVWGRPDGSAITLPKAGVPSPYGIVLPGGQTSLGDVNGDGHGDLATSGGIVLGYGAGSVPGSDTTPPTLTLTGAQGGLFGQCGFFSRYVIAPVLGGRLDETARIDLSVVQGGVTRTGSITATPSTSLALYVPKSVVAAAAGAVQITATPVDGSGNRGAPATISTTMSNGGYRFACP